MILYPCKSKYKVHVKTVGRKSCLIPEIERLDSRVNMFYRVAPALSSSLSTGRLFRDDNLELTCGQLHVGLIVTSHFQLPVLSWQTDGTKRK